MRISSLTEDERFTILWFTALSPSLDLMPIYLLSKKLNLEMLLIIKSMWSCCANERPAKWTANDNVESAAETLRRSIWQIHISPSSVYSGFRLCPEPRAAAWAPHPIPYDEYLTYGAPFLSRRIPSSYRTVSWFESLMPFRKYLCTS
jgi:hypothetical protein